MLTYLFKEARESISATFELDRTKSRNRMLTQVHVLDAQLGQTNKRRSLEQRKVYCKAHARRWVAHVLKAPNPPKGKRAKHF